MSEIKRKSIVEKLSLCPFCKSRPIIEHWSSGGYMYMVKCPSPDCLHYDTYTSGHNLDEVIKEWNKQWRVEHE